MWFATIKHQKELTLEEKRQLTLLAQLAEEDQFLQSPARTLVNSKSKRAIVTNNNVVIGFYIASNVKFNGINYSSIAGVYLLPSYRGQGTMLHVLKTFFSGNKPATVWINDENKASIKLFTRLNFIKDIYQIHEGKPGHWYTLENKITT